jgi:hypothetical protein
MAEQLKPAPEKTMLYCPMCGLIEVYFKNLLESRPDEWPSCPRHSRRMLPAAEIERTEQPI